MMSFKDWLDAIFVAICLVPVIVLIFVVYQGHKLKQKKGR
jgi:hypothetical protein